MPNIHTPKLWRYNERTGYWDLQKTFTQSSELAIAEWLNIFQRDEPDAIFRISKRRPSDNPRKNNPGGRPRKYANDAEKQRAYRERYATVTTRLKPETVATLDRIAESRDIARSDLIADILAWALANRDWHNATRYARPVAPQSRRIVRSAGDAETDDESTEE